MHTPQTKIYDLAETSTFGIFRGRNVRGRNVRAETSYILMYTACRSNYQTANVYTVIQKFLRGFYFRKTSQMM